MQIIKSRRVWFHISISSYQGRSNIFATEGFDPTKNHFLIPLSFHFILISHCVKSVQIRSRKSSVFGRFSRMIILVLFSCLYFWVSSSDKTTPIYFLRLSKVWSILHHGSVGWVHKTMLLNVFMYFCGIFLLFFIIKFVFLSFSFLFLKYQISATEY